MLVSLALCLAALRVGLSIRRARRARRAPPKSARRRHLRLGKPAVALLLAGFVLGPVTVAWLRDWTPMSSFHSLLGGLAALLFSGAAIQGRRLERGDARARDLHAAFAGLALALALAAAVAGFALLP
jgi:Kef-type K+ transport system membrane component KefB